MVYNGFKISIENLYENYLIAASKFYCYIHLIKKDVKIRTDLVFSNVTYIFLTNHLFFINIIYLDFIKEFVNVSYMVLRSSIKTLKTFSVRFDATKEEVTCLGYYAFRNILKRKPSFYKECLSQIERELNQIGILCYRMNSIVKCHQPAFRLNY
jgi:hypothetical protein